MPDDRMNRGGNYWTLFTPRIWKVLHAILHSTVSELAEIVAFANFDAARALPHGAGQLRLFQIIKVARLRTTCIPTIGNMVPS